MYRLELSLLGAPVLTRNGQPLLGSLGTKAKALLFFLAVEQRPHARDSLAALFWPDVPTAQARKNLRNLVAELRRALESHLLIERDTLAFDRRAPYWLDVEHLARALDPATRSADIATLRAATALYRGDFLADFRVADAPLWEAWRLAEQNSLRQGALDGLEALALACLAQNENEAGLAATRRLLQLDPDRESAHRSQMRFLARLGRRGEALAQFEQCRARLARAFGIEPSAETAALAREIRGNAGRGPSLGQPAARGALPLIPPPPPPFVGREAELAHLHAALDAALAALGQVRLIAGEAGSGKSSLVGEWARAAARRAPDLTLAVGHAVAHFGFTDPYLPFAALLNGLAGDEDGKAADLLPPSDEVDRPAPWTIFLPILLEQGPDLLRRLMVPAALLARVQPQLAAPPPSWAERLAHFAAQQLAGPEPPTGEQGQLFRQAANVLRGLAHHQPLCLIFEDLHWADAATLSLFHFLAQQIGRSRILLLATYRPEDVAQGREGERHPLDTILNQLKRLFGAVTLDLDQTAAAEGERFVNALLDAEPNHLSPAFRQALYRHTEGQPLFTVETVRMLQERGDLVRDEAGAWVESARLAWQTLPPRVEGVIAERVARLEAAHHALLHVASVEGEFFTAQVVAEVGGFSVDEVEQRLALPLQQRHRLIQPAAPIAAGDTLARYRFRHQLVQQFLYNELGVTRRVAFHRAVGEALERLHRGATDPVAGQLAWHYEAGGENRKARHFALRAAHIASQRFAYEEALAYLNRALALTPDTDGAASYAVLAAREEIFSRRGLRGDQLRDLQRLSELAESLADNERRAEVALRWATYYRLMGNWSVAVGWAERVVTLAQASGARRLEADGYIQWGEVLWRQAAYGVAQTQLERAHRLFRDLGQPSGEHDALIVLGIIAGQQSRYAEAQGWFRQALDVARRLEDRLREGRVLNNLGIVARELGELAQSRTHHEQALARFRETGSRRDEAAALNNLGNLALFGGEWERAAGWYGQALRINQEIQARHGEGMCYHNLGRVSIRVGDFQQALASLAQARDILSGVGAAHNAIMAQADRTRAHRGLAELGRAHALCQGLLKEVEGHSPRLRGYVFHTCGLVLADLDQLDEAARTLDHALSLRREANVPGEQLETLVALAEARWRQGDGSQPWALADEAERLLEQHPPKDMDDPASLYLTLYRVWQAKDPQRASAALAAGLRHLEQQAQRIENPQWQQLFRHAIPANRALAEAARAIAPLTEL